jgi:hypothetical protein
LKKLALNGFCCCAFITGQGAGWRIATGTRWGIATG